MFRQLLLLSSRAFCSSRFVQNSANDQNPFLYTTNVTDLASKIEASITISKEVSSQTALEALRACRVLQHEIYQYDKFEQDPANKRIQKMIDVILNDEKVKFDGKLLKQVFLLKFPAPTTIKIIQNYYKRDPKAVIDMNTALIALRDSLYNGDINSAVKITDLTAGYPTYIQRKNDQLRRGVYQLAATAIGITFFSKVGVQQVIDMGWLSPAWKHLGSINAMVLTYLLNSSFFVAIVKFGRQLSFAGGDYLTWQKGTFYTHWYKHADEMAMCTRIVETDLKLNGGLENTPSLMEELCLKDENVSNHHTLQPGLTREGKKVRLLEPKDNLEDLKLQAYWMSGGDGFEWVEPDQDPAEILWRQHLAQLHRPGLNSSSAKSLKWAEELIEKPQ
ncbi:CIC11C00000005147 [Sungouiella intermedia]|uniref:CIC11C00000005147 n=1 Tax=Sungouiella intermedia TaxID=45354 RepID=A0A1L0DAD7_9ASCO|nr:CIC11C00000005147 [[Candida] intermedia]